MRLCFWDRYWERAGQLGIYREFKMPLRRRQQERQKAIG